MLLKASHAQKHMSPDRLILCLVSCNPYMTCVIGIGGLSETIEPLHLCNFSFNVSQICANLSEKYAKYTN